MSLSLPTSMLRDRRSRGRTRGRSRRRTLIGVLVLAVVGAWSLAVSGISTVPRGTASVLALWASAMLGAVALAIVAFLRQRRLMQMLVAVRAAGSSGRDRATQIGAISTAIRTGLGAQGIRLDLSASHEGIWTVGQLGSPRSDESQRATAHDLVTLHRVDRTIGTLEVWWPTRLARRLRVPVAGASDHDEILALVADAVAAELEIAGLVELLALETMDHDRSRVQDPLTRLLNRSAFIDEVGRRLTPGSPRHMADAAVAILDVNRFTEINATLGHELGDAVLREVADRVVGALPDGSIVARVGGDELGMLIPLRLPSDHPALGGPGEPQPDHAGAASLHEMMAFVVDRLRGLVDVGEVSVLVDAAIGVSLAPDHGVEATVLLRRAEAAMRVAKDRRTTAYRLWDPTQEEQGARNLELAGDLRTAIEAGHLEVHYQPKTDLISDAVVGVEALVRWRHPVRGWIAPDELIPLAERTGLIGELTKVVLRAALEAGAAWNRQGLSLGVAVNISARGLLDRTLVDDVCAALQATGFAAHMLTLEITETELTPDAPVAVEVLALLRDLGIRIAIDDFGTGYSALGYLSRLHVDELKIDKSFVTDLGHDATKRAIVEAVVTVAASLGLSTVAEGVEDEHVLDRLAAIGCTTAQGFLLSKPLPGAAMAMWLWERRRRLGHAPPVMVIDLTAPVVGAVGPTGLVGATRAANGPGAGGGMIDGR